MDTQEKHQLPSRVRDHLQKQVDKFADVTPVPRGYSKISGILAKGYATTNQLNQLNTFFDNYAPSDADQKEEWETYGGNGLKWWITNTLQHIKTKKELSNKIRRYTDYPGGTQHKNQTGREVDRLTKPSMASIRPANPDNGRNIMNQLKEDLERLKTLMTY